MPISPVGPPTKSVLSNGHRRALQLAAWSAIGIKIVGAQMLSTLVGPGKHGFERVTFLDTLESC